MRLFLFLLCFLTLMVGTANARGLTPYSPNMRVNTKMTPLVTRLDSGQDGRYTNYINPNLTNLGTGPRAPGAGASSTVTTTYRSGRVVVERNGQIISRTGRSGCVNHNGRQVYFRQ